MVKKLIVVAIVILVGVRMVHSKYIREFIEDIAPESSNTVYEVIKDNKKYSVTLTPYDIRRIGKVLKPRIWWDQDYNQRITPGFINRSASGCSDPETCQLVRRVLADFLDKDVTDVYVALGLRREI